MWLFWAAVLVLAAAAALLIALSAVQAARTSRSGEDAALDVLRRQLDEVEDLAQRGLLNDEEAGAIRTEAGRRLLTAADRSAEDEAPARGGDRVIIGAGIAAAALLALALYFVLGAPGAPDQPYKARVAEWRTNPTSLSPDRMAAVLREVARDPKSPKALQTDPQFFYYLGQAELAAGDPFAARRALERAVAVGARSPDVHVALGQAIVSGSEGKITPDAEAQFKAALALDPGNLPARYQLARGRIAAGDVSGGAAALREVASSLPEGDETRAAVLAEADAAVGQAPVIGAQAAAIAGSSAGDQAAFIRGMVGRLAARLKQEPNDVDGWARLVRSYGVLGDVSAQRSAVAEARRIFAGRPADLARIEAEAKAPAPAQGAQ
jgi:cytochrome c-type biogenesis protein CcmH